MNPSETGPRPTEEHAIWPRKKRRALELENVRMEMTPMIDVTFQLLIFFMVTSKFKTLEGLLAAYLPKDKGTENYRIETQSLPIRIVLRWNPTIRKSKVYVGQVLCNYDEQGLRRAKNRVRQALQTGADKAEIDAGGDVPMGFVTQALNMLIECEVKEINFTGSADPLGSNQ